MVVRFLLDLIEGRFSDRVAKYIGLFSLCMLGVNYVSRHHLQSLTITGGIFLAYTYVDIHLVHLIFFFIHSNQCLKKFQLVEDPFHNPVLNCGSISCFPGYSN